MERGANQIADEVISHLAGLVGVSVTVMLEVEADIPSGAPDHVVRAVTQNSQTVKLTGQGFDKKQEQVQWNQGRLEGVVDRPHSPHLGY